MATKNLNSALQVLKACQFDLVDVMLNIDDIEELPMELVRHKVIHKEAKNNFASLDPVHLKSEIKVRYLLQLVCGRVKEEERVYDRLVKVLSRLGGSVRGMCKAMNKKLEKIKGDGPKSSFDLAEVDVPYLVEVLVSCSHKWDVIGIALGLPEYMRDECRDLRDNPSRLSHILAAWISGSYEGAKPATVNVLKKVLSSELVGFPKLVLKLNEFTSRAQISAEPVVPSDCLPEIEYQSYDTEVSEGKSTLLEVQVSGNGCESYQWSKDNQPLLDGADFSGVSSNILYISRASQGTEGKYSCTVSNGRETVCSDEIKLRVLKLSLEKVDLVKLSDCFMNYNIISKYIYERFSSLDQNYLIQDLRFRYLLQQVAESVREDIELYDRLDTVLSELDGILKDLVEIIKSRIDKNIHRPVMKYSSQGDGQCCCTGDDQLRQEDCPHLVQLLLCGGDKWELIGKALTLPEQIIATGKDLRDNCSRLFHILTAWISGNYEDAKPATFNVLQKVLSDELVNLPWLLRHVNELKGRAQISAEPVLVSSDSLPEIEYQSYDNEVSEGKSTLLEVQVSCSRCESYQWSKDGQPLLDGADFSGVSGNILYINRTSQGTEGKYSCTVSNGREIVCSDEINLKVLYSPEKDELIKLYSGMKGDVPKDYWPPVSNSTFINLVLIKQSSISKCDYNTIRGDMDDILESKEEVTYEEVFSEYREGELVLVEGRPGSGKTTLVHKATRDWAKGRYILRGAKAVFLITLRVLNFTGKDKCLSDILEEFYIGEVLRKSVEHNLQECRGRGVCFILDGLDEYQCKNEMESVIYKLMNKKCLSLSMVIVASRPVATDELKKDCDRRIEVVGFTKSQINEYVKTYPFVSSDTCGFDVFLSLKTYLHQHPNVLHMCYLPVHAAMICFLFSELGDNIPHTETQIYEQFTIATLLRQKKRKRGLQQLKYLKDLDGKEKRDFQNICQLALNMLLNSQHVISQSEAPVSLSDLTSSVLSLLTVEHTYRTHGDEHLYTFHHLTFQEFLAAYHIAELEEQEQIRIIDMCKFMKNFNNVMKFYCGRLGTKKGKLLGDAQILQALFDHRSQTNCIQYAFESQHVGMCDYLIKDGCLTIKDFYFTPADFTALGYVISSASKVVFKLVLDCSWDPDGVLALSGTVGTNKLHSIQHLELNSFNCKSEALQCLLSQLPGLQVLDLRRISLSEEYIKSLTNNVRLYQLKILMIRPALNPPCSNPEEVFKLLKFGSNKIEQVYVSVSHAGYFPLWKKWLCYAFGFQVFVDSDISWLWLYNSDIFSSLCPERFSYCTEVALVNCGIDDEGTDLLANNLNTSVLENIVLDFNRICDSGAVALAGCMSRCSVLREVCMECNSIGDSGAIALASALVDCSSLRRLDLQGNAISVEGAVALAKAAADKPHLDLYLHNLNITEEGVKKVLELRARTKLRNMEFSSSWKAINETAIEDLSRALKCGSLPALKISDTNINSIKILVEELEQVRNVKGIECDWNISSDTIPAVCDIIRSTTLKTGKHLHSLSLHNPTPSLIEEVSKCSSNIQSLEMVHCDLDLDDLKRLFKYHKSWFNLHTLNLRNNSISSDGVQVLSKVLLHCNVCFLDLTGGSFDNTGCSYLAEGLQDNTSLLGLTLSSGRDKITSDGVAALIPVFRNNHLWKLDFFWCKMNLEVLSTLVEVICTDALQTLNLNDVGMRLEGVVALSVGLQKCRQLVELNISNNYIGSHGMSFLAEGLKNCRQLVELYIHQNDIGPEGMSPLAEVLKNCRRLMKIGSSTNRISSHGMLSLAEGLKNCSQLEELNISSNLFGSQGMLYLAEGLLHCTNLRVLNLSNNDITSDDVSTIVNVMKACKYLNELDLNFNSISVDDVADLVVGWQHKNVLALDWSIGNSRKSAHPMRNLHHSWYHLLEVYNSNDYIVISSIQKTVSS